MPTPTPNTVTAAQWYHAAVAIDSTNGTLLTTQLHDTAQGVNAKSAFIVYPPFVAATQDRSARHLLYGTSAGLLMTSFDSGATFGGSTPLGVGITALSSGRLACADYPLAYAGDSAGHLLGYTLAQNSAASGTWASLAVAPSAITALAVPEEGSGICWVGCSDGTLAVYWPSVGVLHAYGTLGAGITALAALSDPHVVYGICNDGGVTGLFLAMDTPSGLMVLSQKRSDTYNGLSAVGASLLACGNSTVVWSPDRGVSWATAPTPNTGGPYLSCALVPFDPNEWYAATSSHIAQTQTNGQTYGTALSSLGGISQLQVDPVHPAIAYALAGGALHVSYDSLQTWDSISTGTVTAIAVGALTMGS